MKNWRLLLTTFYLRHGRRDQWIHAEAITDNALCDIADQRHVNATAAEQVLFERDH